MTLVAQLRVSHNRLGLAGGRSLPTTDALAGGMRTSSGWGVSSPACLRALQQNVVVRQDQQTFSSPGLKSYHPATYREKVMPRPSGLDAFVFEKASSHAKHPDLPDLPTLPERPDFRGHGPGSVDFSEQAKAHLSDLADLPSQANVPDWLLG